MGTGVGITVGSGVCVLVGAAVGILVKVGVMVGVGLAIGVGVGNTEVFTGAVLPNEVTTVAVLSMAMVGWGAVE